ncbi:hypothetical protein [Burkholderia mayonis]|uniref:hypothetical protein n=1 Tax=Burkholderia mayonis TaxID=1385591 RepID=UPI00131EECCB|nr:hypothetical protein [Burkholderia mayonis]
MDVAEWRTLRPMQFERAAVSMKRRLPPGLAVVPMRQCCMWRPVSLRFRFPLVRLAVTQKDSFTRAAARLGVHSPRLARRFALDERLGIRAKLKSPATPLEF